MRTATKKENVFRPEIVEAAWTSLMQQKAPSDSVIKSREDLKTFSRAYQAIQNVCRMPKIRRTADRVTEVLEDEHLPKSVVEQIIALVAAQSSGIDAVMPSRRPTIPTVTAIGWRINIIVSTCHLSQTLQPFVELTLTLSDGRVKLIEMTVSKFHTLRYQISLALKQLQSIQSTGLL
uniref:COMM domain-containing protein 5 n=1 Tax=Plectus sambesii TaxID=2011161 RepID=A0A914W572_9BILA